MAISVKLMADPKSGKTAPLTHAIKVAPARRSRTIWSASAVWGLTLSFSVLMLVIFGPFLTPYSPVDFIGAPFEPPSSHALLGTDTVGRDVLSRVLSGGTVILGLSAIASMLGVALGGLLGIFAGYARGLADDGIMRLLDVLLAFPQTILVLLFVSVLGSNFWLIALLVAAIHMPQVARVIRASALRVAREDFVVFAHGIGTSPIRIVVQEILPNVASPLLVEFGLRFTYSIALIAGLSFLGLAQEPPAANWGLMVNENRIGLMQNPWPVLAPIILIALLTVGLNLLTDAYARHAGKVNAGRSSAVDLDEDDL
jgi:peptide/nickel transport system permease protein